MAIACILDHRHRHHRTAPRSEQRHDGIGLVIVEECPATESRKHIGSCIEENALNVIECFGFVSPDEVQIGLLGTLHLQRVDIIFHHLGCFLVLFGQRHEFGYTFGHIGKARVEFAAAATDDFGAEAYRHAIACFVEAFEEAAANFCRRGYGLVTVAEQQR